tara:strand:+ start:1655 stop:2161 length:507 start_codon:yes stop_codon:yes gene_type:complete
MINTPIYMLALFGGTSGDGWAIDYTTTVEGPRVVVEGTAHLYFESHSDSPCLQYEFEVPEGRIAGPVISSDPGQAMMKFDHVTHEQKSVCIDWCDQASPGIQTMPCALPLNFVFYIIKDTFGPDDVPKLLAEWGDTDSSWDLNLDGTVDGLDLAILLGSWETQDGGTP